MKLEWVFVGCLIFTALNFLIKLIKSLWYERIRRILAFLAYTPLFLIVISGWFRTKEDWLLAFIYWLVLSINYIPKLFNQRDEKFREGLTILLLMIFFIGMFYGIIAVINSMEENLWINIILILSKTSNLICKVLCILLFLISLFLVFFVKLEKFKYQSNKLSALLILPLWRCGQQSIMCFQHSTEILKKSVPSNPEYIWLQRTSDAFEPRNLMELLIAVFFSGFGNYAVVMADYPGMGDDEETPQSYCIAESIGKSVVDALNFVLDNYTKSSNEGGFDWDDKIFMTGYSEGGFATLVAAGLWLKEESNTQKRIKLKGCAPLGGVHSIYEKMMIEKFLSDEEIKDGHILPMILVAYSKYYPRIFDKDKLFKSKYKKLDGLVDGYHSSRQVNNAMPKTPKDILDDGMYADIKNPSSEVAKKLKENNSDLFWPEKPTDPNTPEVICFFHAIEDELVPYENSRIASDKLISYGYPNVELHKVKPSCFLCCLIGVHVRAAIPCFLEASKKFRGIREK